jgi:hypothetical protein
MNIYCGSRSSRPARLFSLAFLDVFQRIRLRRARLRAATAGFGFYCLATTFLNNPG